jgi:hypothetical protein
MKYSQDQRVAFNNGVIKGTGKVVGVALSEQPIIGTTFIIEPDEPISNSTYPYTHFVCAELHLKEADDVVSKKSWSTIEDRKDSPHHYDNRLD